MVGRDEVQASGWSVIGCGVRPLLLLATSIINVHRLISTQQRCDQR
jgi:hypothetical protein